MTDGYDVAELVTAYADTLCDAVRSRGCPAGEAIAVLHRTVPDPSGTPDPLASWLRSAEALAGHPATSPAGGDDPAAVPVLRALNALAAGDRRVLTLRDGYDLPEPTAAELLGTDVGALRRRLGAARTRLVSAYDGRPATAAGPRPNCPGEAAELAALADGTLADSPLRLRRHASGCPDCEELLDTQVRARRMLAGLPRYSLPAASRTMLASAAAARAADQDNALAGFLREDAGARPERPAARLLAALALAAALATGVGAGLAAQPAPPAPVSGR